MRQPTKNYSVTWTRPKEIPLEQATLWLKEAFNLTPEGEHVGDEISKFSHLALLLIRELLQGSKIPVYYGGEVVSIRSDTEDTSKVTIQLAVGNIDLIPEEYYTKIIHFSFDALLWMMNHTLTPQNKVELYQACLNEIINPIMAQMPTGKSTTYILKEAYEKNIPFIHLGAGVYQLGWGSKSKKLDRSTTDTDSAIGTKLSENKVLTANLLKMGGFPAPIHGLATTKEMALTLAKELTYPVVIKPVDLNRGEGVCINITDETLLYKAFDEAMRLSLSKQVIVEKQVKGVCHRLFMAEGKLLYAVSRLPISVQGDGIQSVSELIAQANEEEEKKAPWLRKKPFPNDDLAIESIAKCGLTLSSLPQKGEWVPLREIESDRWGGRSEDYTTTIHPDNVDIALRATELFELNVAGIDIITTDITKAWYETGAIINEINFAPLLGGGELSRAYLPFFIDWVMEGYGRIPVEIFIGDDEKTMQTAKDRQKKFIKDGLKCYLTTHEMTIDAFDQALILPMKSAASRVKALFLNTKVDAVILVLQNDELLHVLAPFDSVSNVSVVSMSVKDFRDPSHSVSLDDVEKLIAHFSR